MQISVPGQAAPQAPQLVSSVWRSTQLAPQSVRPAAVHVHVPAVHRVWSGHVLSHAPQFESLATTSTQADADAQKRLLLVEQPQTPHEQLSVGRQAWPHTPQLAVSDRRSTQALTASHQVWPDGHRHVPAEQISDARQACPHAPQSVGLVVMLTQASPHAVRLGVLQRHAPVLQYWPAAHVFPHAPQLAESFWGTHVPLQTRPLVQRQLPAPQYSPGRHAIPHAPQLYSSVKLVRHCPRQSVPNWHLHAELVQSWSKRQVLPQPPQLLASMLVLTQRSPHGVSPVGHLQSPPLQTNPGEHALPHAPQLATSLPRSTHPVGQMSDAAVVGHVHWPSRQTCPAPHTFPQEPQFAAFVFTSTQPLGHASGSDDVGQLQLPFSHTCSGPHAAPQEPQFAASVFGSTQWPPQSRRLSSMHLHAPSLHDWSSRQA